MTGTGEVSVRKYEATLKFLGLLVVALGAACGAYFKATSEAGDIAAHASQQTATVRKEASTTAEVGYATLARAVSDLQAEVLATRKENSTLRDELARKGVLKNGPTRTARPRGVGVGLGHGAGIGGLGGAATGGGASNRSVVPAEPIPSPPPAMNESPAPAPERTQEREPPSEQKVLPPTLQEAMKRYESPNA